MEDTCAAAGNLILNAKRIVVFTGAGISVESGIPDFRSKGGLWERFAPEVYACYETFFLEPKLFWELSDEVARIMTDAKPNAGHLAIRELESLGKVRAVITQNIDNLHQAAGSNAVYELHGNCSRASCVKCKQRYTLDEVKSLRQKEFVPYCTTCKSSDNLIKIDVILFGEPLPPTTMQRAMEEAQNCDLILVVGTSLQVAPASLLPSIAKKSGAKLIFINKHPTKFDQLADVVIDGNAGDVLPKIVEAIKHHSSV
eukprot:TRINITY_DN7662_c0_g1_i4.p1 TRINITY_DN7662_c0_g1~~TRINITY_DN7662_c0_g1_i4.p1  ORF type:complete len:256 (+),score=16.61 TRINITY_DN7662_c0_g1_i4:150-917(+)